MASLIGGRKGRITAKNLVTRTTSQNGIVRDKRYGCAYYYTTASWTRPILVCEVHFFTFIKLN